MFLVVKGPSIPLSRQRWQNCHVTVVLKEMYTPLHRDEKIRE